VVLGAVAVLGSLEVLGPEVAVVLGTVVAELPSESVSPSAPEAPAVSLSKAHPESSMGSSAAPPTFDHRPRATVHDIA
jgi:hypothetical protein